MSATMWKPQTFTIHCHIPANCAEYRLNKMGLSLTFTLPGTTLYVRFGSDDSVHLKGFNISIIPGSYNCEL